MRRREFVVGLGGTTGATMMPALVARSQTSSMPAIGFLLAGLPGPLRAQIASFNQGLRESGLVDGQNIAVEYRWAEGRYDRLPDLAKDLLQRRVAVLVAAPTPSALAGGGLMSYGGSITDAYRVAGVYAGRVLKGEKPADLPVQQSTKIELMLNLNTAKTLGIDVPFIMIARADEVIE